MAQKSDKIPFIFSLREFSGSLGDLGLFIPLVVAMTVSCDLNIGVVLVLTGVLNVITGILFRQPIPVQPMKALAAVVITEAMVKEELFAAGLLMGVILILSSFRIDDVVSRVPKVIVRGIQLGVGIKLAIRGLKWILELSAFGYNSICTALMVGLVLCFLLYKRLPALLLIFVFGGVILYLDQPSVYSGLAFTGLQIGVEFPSVWAFKYGFIKGTLPQLPLTFLNSVIAVCALSKDYYPNHGIAPRRMAMSVGLMNLLTIPFGGIPVCHGSGGLAAQYKFGARSGGSVIMLGVAKIIVGVIFGSAIFQLLQSYPMSILAVMLIFAGFELAKSTRDIFRQPAQASIAAIMSAVIIGCNTLIGFLVGLGLYVIVNYFQKGMLNGNK